MAHQQVSIGEGHTGAHGRPMDPEEMSGVEGEVVVGKDKFDHLFGIVVSTSDYHPRGPGFDSRLYPRNFSGSVGSGTGSTQPHEDNWVAT